MRLLLKNNTFTLTLLLILITISFSKSPENRLFFTCESSGNWDIYSLSPDGKFFNKLTTSPYDEKSIAISPDRNKLITACSDGWIRILKSDSGNVIDSFTTENKPFTANQPQFYDSSFLFIDLLEKDRDLWGIKEFSNSGIREKVRLYGSLFYPVLVPGTKSFIYTYNTCTSGCGAMITELWYFDEHTKLNRQLTMMNTHISSPVFIDKDICLFSALHNGHNDLFTLDLKNCIVKPYITDKFDKTFPSVSPDNSDIAYLAQINGQTCISIFDISKQKLIATCTPIKGQYRNLVW